MEAGDNSSSEEGNIGLQHVRALEAGFYVRNLIFVKQTYSVVYFSELPASNSENSIITGRSRRPKEK